MPSPVLLLGLTALLAAPILCATVGFVRTGDCEDAMKNHYKYTVDQSHFKEGNEESLKIICLVTTVCEEAGTYGGKEARLYSMVVSNTEASGSIFDKKNNNQDDDINTNTDIDDDDALEEQDTTVKSFDDQMAGWFKFVQIDDGSIPAVFHDNGEDNEALNLKKSIAAAFQANFKGTSKKTEADPQSLHVAEYTYDASAQDEAEGIVKMHRKVTSKDVEDYSSHVPGDVVALDREEDIEYKKGVMTHSSGMSTIKMMPEEDGSEEGEGEGDSLEVELDSRKKRDMNMDDYFEFLSKSAPESEFEDDAVLNIQVDSEEGGIDNEKGDENDHTNDDNEDSNYDYGNNDYDSNEDASTMEEDKTYEPNADMPDIDANGNYTLDLIGQQRLSRQERSAKVNHLELPEATESTLMAHINYTKEDMHHMRILRTELGDIYHILNTIHKEPHTATSLTNKVEELLSLEAKYGPLSGYTPAINTIINYLQQLIGSGDELDNEMRALIYFMLSRDGSLLSQKVLLGALDSAINEEEQRTVVTYIAFTENPQPQMISELEDRIGDDTHSTDPLLLAYGALVAKASPDLQQRMTLFLLNRLPLAETNSSSLIHHVLSLGNTESHQAAGSIVAYLQHPNYHVQLSSIHALRYATSDSLVLKALTTLLNQPHVSDEHIATLLQCLLYGVEHASNNHTEKPFNVDLGSALLSSVMNTDNEELHLALSGYFQLINSAASKNLLKLMTSPSEGATYLNSTRLRRGTNWAGRNAVYNLVSPLATRRRDLNVYGYRKAYIWGKRFGVKKGNVQIAAGGFIGVSKSGGYKIFGRVKAIGQAFKKTKTAIDFLVLREKTSRSTRTRLYGEIIGKTLVNINVRQRSIVCKRFSKPLYNRRKYRLFRFQFSIFIYVGTLRFNLAGYVRLNSNLYLQFCEMKGKITAEAGLLTTITMELQAGATANLLGIARGGLRVSAIFNYQLIPKLSTEVCTTNYKIRVKNCVGIYHQWANNRILLDVWYQFRKIKWCAKIFPCGLKWGSRRKWKRLSRKWNLPSRKLRPLWQKCDRKFVCSADTSRRVGRPGVRGPRIRFPSRG